MPQPDAAAEIPQPRRGREADGRDAGADGRTSPKGNKKVLLILVGIAAALLLLCGGVGVGGYLWLRPSAEERAKAEAHKAKLWDLDEFNKAVEGKNAAQVQELLGWPDRPFGDPDSEYGGTWVYYNRLKDSQTGNTETASVRFEKGVVIVTKLWGKDEFNKAVEGKNAAQVRELLGRPDAHSGPLESLESDDGGAWEYYNRIKDRQTGKTESAIVQFKKGVVIVTK